MVMILLKVRMVDIIQKRGGSNAEDEKAGIEESKGKKVIQGIDACISCDPDHILEAVHGRGEA